MNPSPNSPRRITPSDQPVFPCWLMRIKKYRNNGGGPRWSHWKTRPLDLNGMGFIEWSPDWPASMGDHIIQEEDGVLEGVAHLSPSGPKPEQVVGGEQDLGGHTHKLINRPHDKELVVPAAPQSVREAIRKALMMRPVDYPTGIKLDRLTDTLLVALTPFLPAPVAQQDWAKKAVKEMRQRLEEDSEISAGLAAQYNFDDAAMEAILLRHAPAASGGELPELCYLYWSAYHAGHHDTVEGQYTDVLNGERFTYHKEAVKECLAGGDMPKTAAPHLKEIVGDSALPPEPYAQWSHEAQLVRQEKLTSALWGFAHDLQNSGIDCKCADGTTMNSAAMRRAQEIILGLWGQRIIPIQ